MLKRMMFAEKTDAPTVRLTVRAEREERKERERLGIHTVFTVPEYRGSAAAPTPPTILRGAARSQS